jgi:EAL domain-containing protein (putative c-di-GMP-specific phosphodiesterase class I)
VRRLHAVLARQALRILFQPIASLEGGAILGYRALAQGVDVEVDDTAERLLATECRLSERVRQLARTLAVAESAKLPGDLALLVRLHPSEIGTNSLQDSLERLTEVAGGERRMILEVPDSAVSDLPYYREFRANLARSGISIAYSQVSAGARVRELREQPPDYLRFDASLTREPTTDDGRLERVQGIVEAAREIGTQVIASGVETSAQAEALAHSGCPFALGNYFGGPAPAGSLVHCDPAHLVYSPVPAVSDTPLSADARAQSAGFIERVLRKARSW